MRLFFFIVLLINVATFAYLGYREEGGSSNKPALPPLNAERIHLVHTDQEGKRDAAVAQLTCWSWTGFKPASLIQARAALDKLALGDKLTQAVSEEYWVYMAPLKNKRDGEKKLAELKALAIEDGVLLEQPGKWQFAISFAAFPNEDGATIRLNQLKEKGVKSAKILKREALGETFLIQEVDEKLVAALNKLHAEFPETILSTIECKSP